MLLAAEGKIPATVSATANTKSENDRVCSNGKRMTSIQFFHDYVEPLGQKYGIKTHLIESVDENKIPLISVLDVLRNASKRGSDNFEDMVSGISVPLFTNDRTKGRLRQNCTDKWKIRALHQEARRQGVTSLRSAIGFHSGESHRIKARFLFDEGGFGIWKPQVKRDGVMVGIKWLEHYYPCVDLALDREAIQKRLKQAGIPFLVTTECDCCPHQDYSRWMMHTPAVIQEMADIEKGFNGKLFFTDKRIPLLLALEQMRIEGKKESTFGCENGAYCGI